MRHRRYAGCKEMCIFQTLPSDWLLSLTSSAGHAPMLRLVVLHVPKCRQAVLKAVPDRDYCSDSTLAENERGSERGRGESERARESQRERERAFSLCAGSTFARWHQIQGCCPSYCGLYQCRSWAPEERLIMKASVDHMEGNLCCLTFR